MSDKLGLVLLNMGGPDSPAAVEPFLYNLFSDRELIRLPGGGLLQKPFAKLISHFRSRHVRLNYQDIGGSSPLRDWTEKQAAGIAVRLSGEVIPYVAMRYWHPFADETLARMKADGVTRAVVLSMYPHYTGATSGSSVNDFRRRAAQLYPELTFSVIEQWYDWPGYLDALAARIREGLAQFHELLRDEVRILFSAHALPQKFIDRGDPYLRQVTATVEGVMQRVAHPHWTIAFQSRSGPVRWMEPDTVDVIRKLGEEGHNALLMVPISFVSDHIETLHEIDIQYRDLAFEVGIQNYRRAPSLNDGADFLAAMAGLVNRHLEGL
ncbi:ferrochelatase [Geothermobacter hydrogeniphilus]|uniref:Ferrochelatase n=1 Tax=Geothermobacter hydrogeniphilus TaxID=1969733 RepID=A0A1X0Y3W9_9BACT|nr:ferrochelatase [Geothermobacter hydrogeniphilus]ORJ59875.1 ferrochelatase [Geothermobacter hydrogeniphilus]